MIENVSVGAFIRSEEGINIVNTVCAAVFRVILCGTTYDRRELSPAFEVHVHTELSILEHTEDNSVRSGSGEN